MSAFQSRVSNPDAAKAKELGLCLEKMGLPRGDGIQRGFENEAKFTK